MPAPLHEWGAQEENGDGEPIRNAGVINWVEMVMAAFMALITALALIRTLVEWFHFG